MRKPTLLLEPEDIFTLKIEEAINIAKMMMEVPTINISHKKEKFRNGLMSISKKMKSGITTGIETTFLVKQHWEVTNQATFTNMLMEHRHMKKCRSLGIWSCPDILENQLMNMKICILQEVIIFLRLAVIRPPFQL